MSDPATEFSEDDFDPTADEELADSDDEISLEEIVHSLARLLPDRQELQWFDAQLPAAEGLTALQRAGYSQAPVRQGERYLGVFSYRSFASTTSTDSMRCSSNRGKIPTESSLTGSDPTAHSHGNHH